MSDSLLGLSTVDAVVKLIDTSSSNSSECDTEISHVAAVAAASAVVVANNCGNGNPDDAKSSCAVFTPNDDGEVQIDMGNDTVTRSRTWRTQLVMTFGPLIMFLLFIFIIVALHYFFFLVMSYVRHHEHSIDDNFLL